MTIQSLLIKIGYSVNSNFPQSIKSGANLPIKSKLKEGIKDI